MSAELTALVVMLLVALPHIFLPASFRTKETGLPYNVGPRDEPGPPMRPITGRLMRAKDNLYETLPLYIGAVLVVEVAGRNSGLTAGAAWLYVAARVAYLPLYAFGVTYARSMAFAASMAGLVTLLVACLVPA